MKIKWSDFISVQKNSSRNTDIFLISKVRADSHNECLEAILMKKRPVCKCEGQIWNVNEKLAQQDMDFNFVSVFKHR